LSTQKIPIRRKAQKILQITAKADLMEFAREISSETIKGFSGCILQKPFDLEFNIF
jgi:hypothetical protein